MSRSSILCIQPNGVATVSLITFSVYSFTPSRYPRVLYSLAHNSSSTYALYQDGYRALTLVPHSTVSYGSIPRNLVRNVHVCSVSHTTINPRNLIFLSSVCESRLYDTLISPIATTVSMLLDPCHFLISILNRNRLMSLYFSPSSSLSRAFLHVSLHNLILLHDICDTHSHYLRLPPIPPILPYTRIIRTNIYQLSLWTLLLLPSPKF